MRPQVSIIIVSHNTRDFLRQCLLSIWSSRVEAVAEVIVVDTASNDGSAEMVSQDFPDVILARCPNVGFAAGNNRGFEIASGDYIFILNPDTMVLRGCIDTLVRFLDRHPEVAVAGPWIREVEEAGPVRECGGDPPPPTASVAMHERWSNRFPHVRIPALVAYQGMLPSHRSLDKALRVDWVLNAAAMIRRASLSRSYLFDETFFIGTEEIELCKGWLAPKGFGCFLIPSAQVLHFAGQSHASNLQLRMILNSLGQAAIHYRRRQIYGSWWARLDSALAFADHFGLWLVLTFKNALHRSPTRNAQRRVYRSLMCTHVKLSIGGAHAALRIDRTVRALLED